MDLSEQALALLRVSGGRATSGTSCRLEIDGLVPLQFRTYDESPGVGFLRLGNYSTALIELPVERRGQALRGLTITSFDRISPWPEIEVSDLAEGLPVLSTAIEGYEVIDLQDEFKVALRSGEVVVFWGQLARCTGYLCGGAYFLITNGVLAGVWFAGLTDEETNLFASHAGGASASQEDGCNRD